MKSGRSTSTNHSTRVGGAKAITQDDLQKYSAILGTLNWDFTVSKKDEGKMLEAGTVPQDAMSKMQTAEKAATKLMADTMSTVNTLKSNLKKLGERGEACCLFQNICSNGECDSMCCSSSKSCTSI